MTDPGNSIGDTPNDSGYVVDLTSEPEIAAPMPSLTPTLEERALRVRTISREVVRLLIVVLLFVAFITTIVWSFISAGTASWKNIKDLLDLLLPAETALLGTAIAFYMTESRGGRREDR